MAGTITFFWVIALLVSTTRAATPLDEEAVVKHVTDTAAHPLVRPVKDVKEAVVVKFGLTVQSFELDEHAEILKSDIWFNYQWTDPYLTWNESEFGGVRSIRLPIDSIWNTDIQAYNGKGPQQLHKTLVVVYSSGAINWIPTATIGTDCPIDLTYFPFDTQQCTLKFGSWTYDGTKVNLTNIMDTIDLSIYTPNKAWNVVGNKAERNVKTYDCCPEPYIDVTYTLSIARRSSSFTFFYVSPAIILSLLGAAIFVLPPGSAQKTILGGALLICYGLFFVEIGDVLPPVYIGAPIIDRYYTAMYAMLAVSVFLSAVIAKLVSRTSPPPVIIKKLSECLGRLVCVPPTPNEDASRAEEVEICDPKAERAAEGGQKDWLMFAAVLDRVFLASYVFLAVIITLSLLLQYA